MASNTTISVTFDGAGTRVKLDDKTLLTTAFSISENQNVIESNCAYGGTITGEHLGFATPNVLGFGEVTGSVTYDITKNQLDTLKTWLNDRNSSKTINAETGSGSNGSSSSLAYGECYFQSMTLNASENSIVSADVDFWIYKKALTDGSVGGSISKSGLQGATALTDEEKEVIPYWKTKIDSFPLKVIGWNISITQTLVKKFYCEGGSSGTSGTGFDDVAPLPKAVFVGPLNIEMSVTALLENEVVDLSTLSGDLNLTLKIADVDFIQIDKVKLLSVSPDLTAKGMRTIELSYKAYKFTSGSSGT